MISDEAKHFLDEGLAAIQSGKHDEAIQAWSQALELAPDYPEAQTNRGTARSTRGDYQGALADFDAVIAAHPEHADAYLNRANTYLASGRTSEAMADLDTTIRLQPGAADAYYNRGNTLIRIHQNTPKYYDPLSTKPENYKAALADFNKAIELAPRLDAAYGARAGLSFSVLSQMPPPYADNIPQMFRKAEYSQAAREALVKSIFEDINTALKLKPDIPEYLKNRGMLYLMIMNQPEQALQDLSRAIEFNPGFLDALTFRCRAYNKLGRYTEAAQDATRAIELNPGDPNLYFNRGVNRRLMGDHKGAVADLSEVIRITPDNVTAYPNRAEAYTALKDKQAAIADWEKYLALGGGRKFGDEKAVLDKIKKLKSFSLFGR
ncbi:MAG TPA: tetratricopeptide repeat protein [Phototrophicaceae bacterium]|jgi:tetratricopeptide (TPR) repeat protein|nr:tetratricopeptide repeat protein [Phototrophicaceae bacterium]